MDLNTLSLPELRKLRSKVDAEIGRRQDTGRKALLKRIQKMAADEGLTLEDVLGSVAPTTPPSTSKEGKRSPRGTAKASAKPKNAFKYFHPTDPKVGWTGHGRRPAWVIKWVEDGNSLDSLLKQG